MNFNKGVKLSEEKIHFSTSGAGKTVSTGNKLSWTLPLPFTETNSKWIKEPNIRAKTTKLFKENRGNIS